MSKPLVLRCQFGGGQRKVLNGLTASAKLSELLESIFTLTSVPPHMQRIMSGFPPKELDLSDTEKIIQDISIRSGDTLIIEERKDTPRIIQSGEPNIGYSAAATTPQLTTTATKTEKLVRKVVPADNSCLFASVSFVMINGNTEFASDLRQLAATCISDDPITYNEAFLGKSNPDYCAWLLGSDHWGGAIELNVFSQYYQTEINVADIQSGRIDRFGEDAHYSNRVFILYDGIHYDPLGLESNGQIVQTVFPSSNFNVQVEALALAEDCKKVS